MKKALNYICAADLAFIALLSLSSSFGGAVSTLFYYVAFLLPIVLLVVTARSGGIAFSPPRLLPSRADLKFLLPAAAPFLSLVLLISLGTSLLLGALGFESTTDVSGNLFLVVIKHALLPALLEEGLFRLLPIAFAAPHSQKGAVLFSSLFFALIHCNLFQIPYAFAAGLVLSAVTVLSGSIFSAVLLHFINNLLSVILMRADCTAATYIALFVTLSVLSAISLVYIFVKRKDYRAEFERAFCNKCKLEFTISSILLIGTTLFVAIFNLMVNV